MVCDLCSAAPGTPAVAKHDNGLDIGALGLQLSDLSVERPRPSLEVQTQLNSPPCKKAMCNNNHGKLL